MALPFDVKRLIEICRQNDVSKIGLFGSMARGEANENSDIDLLVEFSRRGISLWDVIGLEHQLAEALGRKVDLVTEGSLSPYLRDRILADLQVIYEA